MTRKSSCLHALVAQLYSEAAGVQLPDSVYSKKQKEELKYGSIRKDIKA